MASVQTDTAEARVGRPASRLATSFRMQAIEHRRRVAVLLLVLALPLAFFSGTYYTAGTDPIPLKVPERTGIVLQQIPDRETWPVAIGLIGVAWGMAAAAFFTMTGSLQRDRRLVLSGYRSWQILLARLGILATMNVILSFAALGIFAVATSSLDPEITWLAAFMMGLMSNGVGLLLGGLIPRPTEGMLVIIGLFGTGMSLGDAEKYFFTWPATQLLWTGRFAVEPWPLPFVLQALATSVVFVLLALVLWWRRTRVAR